MPDTTITRRDFKILYTRLTGETHRFIVKKFRGWVLEIEDVHFHHNSAVMLPDYEAVETPDAVASPDRITSLAAVVACYDHAGKHPDQKSILAGHADTTGAPDYNIELSEMRSENVLAVLQGDKEKWVSIAKKRSKTEDYQLILKWLAAYREWDCDPGTVDNIHGPITDKAVKNFQTSYNEEFGGSLKVDGIVGEKTWGAIFDLYMEALMDAMGTDAAGLAAARAKLKFLNDGKKTVGCGESWPIEAPRKNEYRSRINRRVEILFFEPGQEPLLDCHPGPHKCSPPVCEIYNVKMYVFKHIPVLPISLKGLKSLKLTKVDDHFAPSKENNDFVYELRGLSRKTITLEVTHPLYADNPIFKQELKPEEKTNGTHTFAWDGKANCTAGYLVDRYIHPQIKPYKVHLFHDAVYTDEKEFKVLVHSLELKLGKFDKGIFDNADTTNTGHRERLKALGYFHEDVTVEDATDAKFKKAVEWFQSEHDAGAPVKGTVGDSTKTALNDKQKECIEGGVLPSAGTKKIYVSGAFFYKVATDLDSDPAPATFPPAAPRNHRFSAEKTFWDDGLKIPVYAKIYLKKKDDSKVDAPKAVGPQKVIFEWIDVLAVAALAGKQKDYIEKARNYDKAVTQPTGENCHKDRGGKRGDDITKVFPENADTTKFPFEVKKGSTRTWAAVSTARLDADDEEGMAGVIFRPCRMGGEGYKIHAYLHNFKDLDTAADKAAAPDVEVKTGEMFVWRRVRVNQYLHKPHASINTIDIPTVNVEMAKAFMEFTGSLAKADVTNAVWTAKVTAALSGDGDFATIGHIDYASANTIDFKSHAAYTAAGGALGAAAYTALCRGKVWPWVELIIKEFAKDQFHGMTVMRVANAHASYVTNSGAGFADGVCYIWWAKATYDAKSYVVEKYAAHEMGHCLYLRHHYTAAAAGPPAGWPASDNPNDHDADDAACAMSYFQTAWHFCGKCILKLRGWDEDKLSKDDDANKKP